eukprot:gene30555-37794_t
MALDHFHLTRPPFNSAPDPAFHFEDAARRELLGALQYALKLGDGVIKVTGEPGSGKSLLCNVLAERLAQTAPPVQTLLLGQPPPSQPASKSVQLGCQYPDSRLNFSEASCGAIVATRGKLTPPTRCQCRANHWISFSVVMRQASDSAECLSNSASSSYYLARSSLSRRFCGTHLTRLMTNKGFNCSSCGQYHSELPMVLGSPAPAAWDALAPAERTSDAGSGLSSDQCVIRGKHFFILGRLEIPVIDGDHPFTWLCWVSVNEKSFDRACELWAVEGRESEPPYFAWMQSALPYPVGTLNLQADCHGPMK